MKFIFGPVFSRRLGRSLGVDLVPFKYCSQDCIYCQLGRTTYKTIKREIYQSPKKILQELELKLNTKPDFITIAGSGEPTLCKNLGEIIKEIKSITDIPIAVLTNGTLLYLQDVRNDLLDADIVCPSLDAGNEDTFQKVNRPSEDINFDIFLNGLITFRKEYKGKIWLEIMLIKGVNDSIVELRQIADCASLISPDKIHLNTVTRPPADSGVIGVSHEEMLKICDIFNPPAEIIAKLKVSQLNTEMGNTKDKLLPQENIEERIIEILQRHPSTPLELSAILGSPINNIISTLDRLMSKGKVTRFTVQNKELFRVKNPYD